MSKRIAVVTGANRGLGLEISRQLANAGVCIVMTSRDQEKGEAALAQLSSAGLELRCETLDVTDDGSVNALADKLENDYGRVDILVNNAGILFDDDRQAASILEQSIERVRVTLETNFYGALRVSQALAPLLKRSDSGRVVNVSSNLGLLTGMSDQYPAYGLSKTAKNALTRMLAHTLAEHGVLVNSVCPGLVATDMGGAQGRPVEEGADTAVWLALLADDGPTGGCFRDREVVAW